MVCFVVCASGDDIGAALGELMDRSMRPGRRRALHLRRVRKLANSDNTKKRRRTAALQNLRNSLRFANSRQRFGVRRFRAAFFERATVSARIARKSGAP